MIVKELQIACDLKSEKKEEKPVPMRKTPEKE